MLLEILKDDQNRVKHMLLNNKMSPLSIFNIQTTLIRRILSYSSDEIDRSKQNRFNKFRHAGLMSIRSFLKALTTFKTTKKSIMDYGKGSFLISSFFLESDICFNLSTRLISSKNRTSQQRDALINLGLLDKAIEELNRLEGIIDTASLKNSHFVNVINLILGDNIQAQLVSEYFCFEPVQNLITKFPPKNTIRRQ